VQYHSLFSKDELVLHQTSRQRLSDSVPKIIANSDLQLSIVFLIEPP
jgi:hypothetical protein